MENVKNHFLDLIDEFRSAVVADDYEACAKIFQRLNFVAQAYFGFNAIVRHLSEKENEVDNDTCKAN